MPIPGLPRSCFLKPVWGPPWGQPLTKSSVPGCPWCRRCGESSHGPADVSIALDLLFRPSPHRSVRGLFLGGFFCLPGRIAQSMPFGKQPPSWSPKQPPFLSSLLGSEHPLTPESMGVRQPRVLAQGPAERPERPGAQREPMLALTPARFAGSPGNGMAGPWRGAQSAVGPRSICGDASSGYTLARPARRNPARA